MIVDKSSGAFLTQRGYPQLALLDVRPSAGSWEIRRRGQTDVACVIPKQIEGSLRTARVWDDQVSVRSGNIQANRFFSEFLDRDVEVVSQAGRRAIPEKYGTDLSVSLADSMPILLTSTSSLESLNQSLVAPISMTRFRPNIVVSGLPAHQEMEAKEILIGEILYRVAKPCSRCIMVNVDPESGRADRGGPVFKQLVADAAAGAKANFGVLLLPTEKSARVRVGDTVNLVLG